MKIMMRIEVGCIVPADQFALEELKARKYSKGDIVSADLRKPRNPKFHGLAHGFGKLVAENIESFEGMKAHSVLKRLQLEGRIECEEVAYRVEGCGMVIQSIPKSLSFASMSNEVFSDVFERMCKHIIKVYWNGETTEGIERMIELMPS